MSGGTMSIAQRLVALRKWMQSKDIQAFIVGTADAHQSEYVAPVDARREFVCGFDGSAGTAVVTADAALLWTDARYYLQAEQQLEKSWWQLMKASERDTPTIPAWINENLPTATIGVDAALFSHSQWRDFKAKFAPSVKCAFADPNPIDGIWADQPARPSNKIKPHSERFSGCTWRTKVARIVERMRRERCHVLVLSALDDIAWLLNLRGTDIVFNPVFFSYVVIHVKDDSNEPNVDVHVYWSSAGRDDADVQKHLANTKQETRFDDMTLPKCNVTVVNESYDKFTSEALSKYFAATGEMKRVWADGTTSQMVHNWLAPVSEFVVTDANPVPLMKAIKNPIEVANMKLSQVYDAAALCQFFGWLQSLGDDGLSAVDEVHCSDKVLHFRQQCPTFKYPSFATISSVGANGAVIHYKPTPGKCAKLSPSSVYLLDSGGQYDEGTTDTTRTVWLGSAQPPAEIRHRATLVLQGHLDLATVVFPKGKVGNAFEVLARKPLWDEGLDYGHGTGHGVGQYLNVHEGPCRISYIRPNVSEMNVALTEGMIMSDEPGYYKDHEYGIRIESLICVAPVSGAQAKVVPKDWLCFDYITPVPIQSELIDPNMLTEKQLQFINDFHKHCLETVMPELQKRKGTELGQEWLRKYSKPLARTK